MRALRFATTLYRGRLGMAYHGYLRHDPMSRLHLAPGRDDPYVIYEALRARGDLVPTRLGNHVSPSHTVCNTVLRDRRFGVRTSGTTGPPLPGSDQVDMSFLDRDPPDHTRLRRLAQPSFGPRQIAAFRPQVEQTVDKLLGTALEKGTFDLVSAFSAPLPIAVITDLLGVPDADASRFAEHGAVIGSALDGIRSLRHAARLKAASDELDDVFIRLITQRRARSQDAPPTDDVLGRILATEGDQIQAHEILPLLRLLLVAGFETTVNLIGNAVNALLDHPAQWDALCADPAGLAAAAIEETLRWDPPVQRTARCAREDVELAGQVIRRGQFVVTLLGAANRDPAVHTDAGRCGSREAPGPARRNRRRREPRRAVSSA